jgi:hypothetical protein
VRESDPGQLLGYSCGLGHAGRPRPKYSPRWTRHLLVIRRNDETGQVLSLAAVLWGLIPYWCQDPKGGRKPINAKCGKCGIRSTSRQAMSTSRHREIACAIIVDTLGRFLLQQRDDISGIIHPGKVGLFGGHRPPMNSYRGTSSAPELSATDRQAQPSGTRIPTGLLKSQSIRGGRIASSVSRLAIWSRLSLE